jgi:hypothetical protein
MTTTLPPPTRPPEPAQRHGIRIAWIVAGAIIAVVTLGWGTAQTVSVMARDRFTETTAFDAEPISRIEVDNDHGDVEVRIGELSEIVVVERVDSGLQPPDREVGSFGDTVNVFSSCDGLWTIWCEVDHAVLVPAGTEVQVSASEGDVRIDGDLGRISVVANEGHVEIRVPGDVAYAIDATTKEGDVTIEVPTDPSAPRVIQVRAAEGDVVIRPLP